MKKIVLENRNDRGEKISATFFPEKGMNMASYKKEAIEVIDQKTMPLFEERLAGLGPLIGPHFHHRPAYAINTNFDESLFPHIARIKKKGVVEPFSHGIARYVPWKYEASSTQIEAKLCAKDEYKGIPLGHLEGMDFEMHLSITMMPFGLFYRYSIESEKPSVIGLHTYYHFPSSGGTVTSAVKSEYRDREGLKPLPNEWVKNGALHFDLKGEADFGFFPEDPANESRIIYTNKDFSLHIFYDASTEDHSWQLFRLNDSSYVCIEPLSSKTPRNPTKTSSLLEVKIEIY